MPSVAPPKLRLLVRHSATEQDAALAAELIAHLRPLERFAGVDVWNNARIRIGDPLHEEIERAIDQADLVLLLLSPDFLSSDALVDIELPKVLERHRSGRLHVVPIVLRSCSWELHPALKELHPLPEGGKPIGSFSGNARDDVLKAVVQEILGLVTGKRLQGKRVLARFCVPFLSNPAFVGRGDDLEALHGLLQGARAAGVRPAALTGMGGIGKTQLAVEYAYRYRDAYPGGIYWVNAAESWQDEFVRLALEVGLNPPDAPESERDLRLALAFAEYLEERPDALVVFDNVDDPLALRGSAAGFIPEQLGCALLFTTRRRDPDSPYRTVDVRVLPEDFALRLLLSGGARSALLDSGPAADIDAAKMICASLGYLPLALVLAAAYLARYPRITLGHYLARVRKEGALAVADAEKVDHRRLGTLHKAAVDATLLTQWEAIASEDAKLLLEAAALLGEAALIPRARLALLTGLADEAEPGYPAPLDEALRELGGLSLVEELTERDIRLHPLVREFAERRIEGREAFAAACAERLGDALWDMGRLHEEVAGRGIDAVLGDLRAARRLAGIARIEALMRPLDRESHALRRWDAPKQPGFFLQQLRNRCFEMGIEEVRERAEAQLEDRRWPWMRARFRTSCDSEALVRTLVGHTDKVFSVAVTADGRFAVSASTDQTMRVWELSTGQAVRTIERSKGASVRDAAVTLGRPSDAPAREARVGVRHAEDSRSTTLEVYDRQTGRVVHTLEGHTKRPRGVVVTPDGHFAISASDDKSLRVWDLETGKAVRTFEGHSDKVYDVAVTLDGRFAISASKDKTLKVWDLGARQDARESGDEMGAVNDVAVTTDGRFAISNHGYRGLKAWDLCTGQANCSSGEKRGVPRGVAVTSDARLVIVHDQDKITTVWDPRTGSVSAAWDAFQGQPVSWLDRRPLEPTRERTLDGRCRIVCSLDRIIVYAEGGLNMISSIRPEI